MMSAENGVVQTSPPPTGPPKSEIGVLLLPLVITNQKLPHLPSLSEITFSLPPTIVDFKEKSIHNIKKNKKNKNKKK